MVPGLTTMDLPIRRAHGLQWIGPALIGLFVLLCFSGSAAAQKDRGPGLDGQTGRQPHRLPAHLYFAEKKGRFLTAEERTLLHPGTPEGYGKEIIQGLINGSRRGLMRTIPPDTQLRALYISKDGTAYVDLTKELTTRHSGGIQMERLTIYAIVNSLILNVSEIEAVKILIDGRESLTLAGHMDLRFPFKAEMLLVR